MRTRHLDNALHHQPDQARIAQTPVRASPKDRRRPPHPLPPVPLGVDPRHAQMTDMARAVDRWLTGAALGLAAVLFVVQLLRWVFS